MFLNIFTLYLIVQLGMHYHGNHFVSEIQILKFETASQEPDLHSSQHLQLCFLLSIKLIHNFWYKEQNVTPSKISRQ